jgi:hypothetical protein
MRHTVSFFAVLLALGAAAAGARAASTLCVGGPGCFATVQAAVDAAHDGDTITIAPGTYAGGITIDVSVDVRGAGAGQTVIKGGGPVLVIGKELAATEPTVSIRGVTITGGFNNSVPDASVEFAGGVEVPWAAGFTTGATVTIADSVIAQNRVAPQQTIPSGDFCGSSPCAFPDAGAVFDAGTLTVTGTRISDNVAGATPGGASVASGAFSGGIDVTPQGTLLMRHSVVTGNRAAATAPNGQSAGGGGINSNGPTTIEDSVVSGNSVDVTNAGGDFGEAFAGGIDARSSLVLRNSLVQGNTVSATVSSLPNAFVVTDAGGIEIDGTATITNTSVLGNSVAATAPGGLAAVAGGGLLSISAGGVALRNSLVAGNRIAATTASGSTFAQGGGIANFGLITLDHTAVVGNSGSATGPSSTVQGGGIWNSDFDGGPPVVAQLTLVDSLVTGNRLSGSPGAKIQGGGLYTTFPVVLTRTLIVGNQPDQCFGC